MNDPKEDEAFREFMSRPSQFFPARTDTPVVQHPDCNATHGVQIHVDSTGRRAWINVDGICALRVFSPFEIVVKDDRKHGRDIPKSEPIGDKL